MPHPHLLFGTKQKVANALVTTYLKGQCILPVSTPTIALGKIALAGAAGTFTPYTAGYVCLALIYKNGAGERNIARDILDIYAQQGVIKELILSSGGIGGYTVADILNLSGGTGGTARVDAIDGDGKVTQSSLVNPGTEYENNSNSNASGGTGTGASFTVYTDMMQHAAGWWYDHYNPYLNSTGYAFDRVTVFPNGNSGDLLVDSDAAMLVWAMADYDQVTAGTRYQNVVRKALSWLRTLQVSHNAAHGTNLISNLVYQGVTDTTALTADCGEVLLACKRAMDAYGVALTTSAGYSVQTMANALYTSMTTTIPNGTWGDTDNPVYRTSFPIGQNDAPPFAFNYVDPITYTQSICARANYDFVNSGYLTAASNVTQAELCLDYTYSRMAGEWGGQFYTYFNPANLAQTTQIEYLAYTALMCLGMQAVNATKYANQITGMKAAIQWKARANGAAWSQTKSDGALWRSILSGPNVLPEVEGYGFVVIDIAQALLTGA